MESLSKVDEPFPTPPPYFLPGKNVLSWNYIAHIEIMVKNISVYLPIDERQAGQDVRIYHIHSPFSPPPPPPSFSFSPGVVCSTQSPLPGTYSTLPPFWICRTGLNITASLFMKSRLFPLHATHFFSNNYCCKVGMGCFVVVFCLLIMLIFFWESLNYQLTCFCFWMTEFSSLTSLSHFLFCFKCNKVLIR